MLASIRGGGLGDDDDSNSGSGCGEGDSDNNTSVDVISNLLMQGAAINAQTDRTGKSENAIFVNLKINESCKVEKLLVNPLLSLARKYYMTDCLMYVCGL